VKILGIIIILFGVVDLVGSYAGFDVWTDYIGVTLPEILWKFSSYIEIAIGYFIMTMGSAGKEVEAE